MKARLTALCFCIVCLLIHALAADPAEAEIKLFQEIFAKAEKGVAESQYELAMAFDTGQLGVTKDEYAAARWYRKAAEQNHARAQTNLGFMYEQG